MRKGLIVEGKVCCPHCGKSNYRILDYNQVEKFGMSCTKFNTECRECETRFYYYYKNYNMNSLRFIDQPKEVFA